MRNRNHFWILLAHTLHKQAMGLRTLRSFAAIVDAGSLTRATTVLHIAQPALTAQIKRFEAHFSVQLLARSPAGVKLGEGAVEPKAEVASAICDGRWLARNVDRDDYQLH